VFDVFFKAGQMSPSHLFPDEDYSFQMRFTRQPPEEFFRPTGANPDLLAQRRHWLQTEPDRSALLLPEAKPLLDEIAVLARDWNSLPDGAPFQTLAANSPPQQRLIELGMVWEPDFLLLKVEPSEVRLIGGCVCFPSSWSLEEKMGRPIEMIHDVVPSLNATLGNPIATFLKKLRPGVAWLRSNWGISRSAELNQHPARRIQRLEETVRLEEAWLRIENQALVCLPQSAGVLFGIRIEVHCLADVIQDKAVTQRLARALRTMPEPMAQYKGLAAARKRLANELDRG
jgi:hypothetical protein